MPSLGHSQWLRTKLLILTKAKSLKATASETFLGRKCVLTSLSISNSCSIRITAITPDCRSGYRGSTPRRTERSPTVAGHTEMAPVGCILRPQGTQGYKTSKGFKVREVRGVATLDGGRDKDSPDPFLLKVSELPILTEYSEVLFRWSVKPVERSFLGSGEKTPRVEKHRYFIVRCHALNPEILQKSID